jgi:hypothetical protein
MNPPKRDKVDGVFERNLSRVASRQFPNVQLRTQLLVEMAGLQRRLGNAFDTQFAREYGVPRARIDQFQDDTWEEMSRQECQTLLVLEREARERAQDSQFGVFRLVKDPIWETFESSPALKLTGRDLDGHAVSEDITLVGLFARAGIKFQETAPDETSAALRNHNCLIMGSPKCNKWTEDALEAMWPSSEPPIRFHWPDWPDARSETRVSKKGERKISSLDEDGQWRSYVDGSPERPVGALVVCRKPLGTNMEVTTVVVAGCTKFGTLKVVSDLLFGHIRVRPLQIEPGRPSVLILRSRKDGKRWYNADLERELYQRRQERRRSSLRPRSHR